MDNWMDVLTDEERMAMNLAASATGSEVLYTPEGVQVRCGADRLGLIDAMRAHGFCYVREFYSPLVSAKPPEEQRHGGYWHVIDFKYMNETDLLRERLRRHGVNRSGMVDLLHYASCEEFEYMAHYTDDEMQSVFDLWLSNANADTIKKAVKWCDLEELTDGTI